VETIENFCQALQLKPIIPAQRRREDVLSHLGAGKIFHFAGHDMSELHDPLRSCLLLEDWKSNPLTVADLRNRGTRDSFPFLRYLSACSTGVSKVSTLMDEGVHLVSALQRAELRHVVGTLWAVYDDCCPDIARIVYEQLQDEMTDIAVCQGLHRAIKSLRDNYISELADSRDGDRVNKGNSIAVERPLYWVPFVHSGV
jgi:CHAT domain-containing protein